MRIDIITVLPEMLESPLNCSILKRAQDKGLAEIVVHNLRDYTTNKHRKVDDYPFGGDAGMVIQVEPVDRCISALKAERNYDEVIFTAPDGEVFNQRIANSLSLLDNIIYSADIIRESSALTDSFQDNLLEPPIYTRPAEYKGWGVPEILLSGHQAKIDEWRHEQSLERTRRLRPDLLND